MFFFVFGKNYFLNKTMRYLKFFDLLSEYNDYNNSNDYLIPNVSYVVDNKKVYYSSNKKSNAITDNYLTIDN